MPPSFDITISYVGEYVVFNAAMPLRVNGMHRVYFCVHCDLGVPIRNVRMFVCVRMCVCVRTYVRMYACVVVCVSTDGGDSGARMS